MQPIPPPRPRAATCLLFTRKLKWHPCLHMRTVVTVNWCFRLLTCLLPRVPIVYIYIAARIWRRGIIMHMHITERARLKCMTWSRHMHVHLHFPRTIIFRYIELWCKSYCVFLDVFIPALISPLGFTSGLIEGPV